MDWSRAAVDVQRLSSELRLTVKSGPGTLRWARETTWGLLKQGVAEAFPQYDHTSAALDGVIPPVAATVHSLLDIGLHPSSIITVPHVVVPSTSGVTESTKFRSFHKHPSNWSDSPAPSIPSAAASRKSLKDLVRKTTGLLPSVPRLAEVATLLMAAHRAQQQAREALAVSAGVDSMLADLTREETDDETPVTPSTAHQGGSLLSVDDAPQSFSPLPAVAMEGQGYDAAPDDLDAHQYHPHLHNAADDDLDAHQYHPHLHDAADDAHHCYPQQQYDDAVVPYDPAQDDGFLQQEQINVATSPQHSPFQSILRPRSLEERMASVLHLSGSPPHPPTARTAKPWAGLRPRIPSFALDAPPSYVMPANTVVNPLRRSYQVTPAARTIASKPRPAVVPTSEERLFENPMLAARDPKPPKPPPPPMKGDPPSARQAKLHKQRQASTTKPKRKTKKHRKHLAVCRPHAASVLPRPVATAIVDRLQEPPQRLWLQLDPPPPKPSMFSLWGSRRPSPPAQLESQASSDVGAIPLAAIVSREQATSLGLTPHGKDPEIVVRVSVAVPPAFHVRVASPTAMDMSRIVKREYPI
jgi:hypothetical protein